MTDRRHPNVLNLNEVEPRSGSKGTRFAFAAKTLGRPAGAKGIGCTWYEVPPGKTAFPAHYHCANEEAIFILEGKGTLRMGKDTIAVAAGDSVTIPTGPEHAHQLINDGDAPLRYLCFSTMHTTEVVGYPDSGKLGVVGMASIADFASPWVRAIFKKDVQVDYYDGEKTD